MRKHLSMERIVSSMLNIRTQFWGETREKARRRKWTAKWWISQMVTVFVSLFLWCTVLIPHPDSSANQPMFVKNTALLQDVVPRDWERATRHRDETLEPRSPACNTSFGKPRYLTHDSDPPDEPEAHGGLPTSSPAPPPQSSSPPLAEAELPLPAPTPPVIASLVPMHVTPPRQPSGSMYDVAPNAEAQAPAPAQRRIPSSSSPSPMKLPPSSSLPDAFVASSPARLPDTDAITKALHESLTSLLGKRPIAEEDEEMKDAVGVGVKKGKRMRPGGQSNVCVLDSVLCFVRAHVLGIRWYRETRPANRSSRPLAPSFVRPYRRQNWT